MTDEVKEKLKKAGFKSPTLSKLIQACGKDFLGLLSPQSDVMIKTWRAMDKDRIFFGDTPEEAVANLWLELHNE